MVRAAVLHPAARDTIRSFPVAVRRELGKAIYDLQLGKVLGMPISRPMPSVGLGTAELRIRDDAGIYRAFYYTSSRRGILVFHAFMKKSQAIPTHELQLGKRRLKEMLHEEV